MILISQVLYANISSQRDVSVFDEYFEDELRFVNAYVGQKKGIVHIMFTSKRTQKLMSYSNNSFRYYDLRKAIDVVRFLENKNNYWEIPTKAMDYIKENFPEEML